MKLNTKDLISGGIFILIAGLGLWLNLDHTLGSARRMGPGYMPMLTFWLLLGIGAIVFFIGLGNGPDPLEKWSGLDIAAVVLSVVVGLVVWQIVLRSGLGGNTYLELGLAQLAAMLALSIARGWQPLGLVHAGMALFGLTLESLGLMGAIAVTVVVSCLAERTHTVKGVLGCVVFLCALCWWVFIRQLDIRVNVWPTFL
jgi:hypothetical protein